MSDPFQVVRDFEKAVCDYTGAPSCVAVNSCTMALLLACAWYLRRIRLAEIPELDTATKNILLADDIRFVDQLGYPPSGMSLGTTPNFGRKRLRYLENALWQQYYIRLKDISATHGGSRSLPLSSDFEIPARTYVSVPMSIRHAGGRVAFRQEQWLGSYQLKPYPIHDSARYFSGDMWKGWPDARRRFVCVSFQATKTLGDTQGGAILHNDAHADLWLRRARFDGRTEGVAPKDDHFTHFGWHCYMSPDIAARLMWKLGKLPARNEPLPNDDYPDLSKMEIFK